MGAARLEAAFQQGEAAEALQHLIAGVGILGVGLAGRVDRHLLAVGLGAAQICLHKALVLRKAAVDDGLVGALHARCAKSFFATISSPDVSLSMRWTMPGRISPPMPERLPLQCQSRAFTSVPSGLPGAGWTTMPLGLFTTRRWSSSYTMSSGMSCGTASIGFASGISNRMVSPALSLRLLAMLFPLQST